MSFPTRREFLKRVAYGSAAASALAMPSRVRAVEPSERVRTAVIGLGGQGTALLNRFRQIDDVEIAYVCDPDKSRLAKGRALTDDGAEAVTDLRRILDDKTVDAVIIAAPDYWHAPAGILACDAGKHVYVEKPCSHNLRESRWLLTPLAGTRWWSSTARRVAVILVSPARYKCWREDPPANRKGFSQVRKE